MNLPQDFCRRMTTFLGEEAEDFFLSYQSPAAYGLRINALKDPDEQLLKKLPFTLSPIPWARGGFYASYDEHPGKHPFHAAGAYYIQEPSAMSVVELLHPVPGEIICDLCAAPGGKSTQIAARMQGKGLLVSNEIIPSRAKILSENMERFGITNAVLTNESPEHMASHFPHFFDKILVDAPCSGEGMFRKDDTAIREWTPQTPDACATRQKGILKAAVTMLKPGGTLVYSTCTFSEEENENVLSWLCEEEPCLMPESWKDYFPENTGIVSSKAFPEAMRLFPHKLRGEGHFAARLRHTGQKEEESRKRKKAGKNLPPEYLSFLHDFITRTDTLLSNALFEAQADRKLFGQELYLIPKEMNTLHGLKVVRAGLHLGTLKKNRFEPSHALAKAAFPSDFTQAASYDLETITAFLHGETIDCPADWKGWGLVCYEGLSIGLGKADRCKLKNHYPKGLRTLSSSP